MLPGDKRPPRSNDQTGTLLSGRSNAKKARLSVSSSNSEEALSNSPKTYTDIARQRDERLDKKPLGEYGLYVTGPNKGPIDEPTFLLVRQLLAKKEFEKHDIDNTYIWCNIISSSFASGRGQIALNDPESVEIIRKMIPEISAKLNSPMECYSPFEYDQKVVLKVRFSENWDMVSDKLSIVKKTLSMYKAPHLEELSLRRVINMTGKHKGKIGFVAMNTETAKVIVRLRGNFAGPGAQLCFWDGNGKPVNQGPLEELIEKVDRYKLITSLEAQAQSDDSDLNDDLNLNRNWDNGALADYVEDVHLHEGDIDPETEFPLGRASSHLAAGPNNNSGTEANALVPEPLAQDVEAMTTTLQEATPAECEIELSNDDSNSTCVEDDQMEISPDLNIANKISQ